MSNETIATETTEAVGELPIDELLSDGITNTCLLYTSRCV